MKKHYWKVLLAIISLLCIVVALMPITLVKQTNRSATYKLSQKEKAAIPSDETNPTVDDAIEFAMDYSCDHLSFAQTNNIRHGRANCIGYAQLFAAVFNAYCQRNGIRATAMPVVGYVNVFGVNLCRLAKSVMPSPKMKNFVKDHDFVEISTGRETIYLDPTIKDMFGRSCRTKKRMNRVNKDSHYMVGCLLARLPCFVIIGQELLVAY